MLYLNPLQMKRNQVKKKQQRLPRRNSTPPSPNSSTGQSDNLRFTLLGGVALYPLDRLKVTLKMERTDTQSPLHRLRHQLDLYQDETVEKLARKAAGRLEVSSTKLHTTLAGANRQTGSLPRRAHRRTA